VSEEQPEPPRPADRPAPDAPHEAEPDQEPDQEPARPVEVRLRRAPRYRAFVAAGAVLGAALGVVLALARGAGDSLFSTATVTGYLGAIGLLLGALLGGAAAVLADRAAR
jgi:hypothetical protein